LWIGAICINQADIEEKDRQVSVMDDILPIPSEYGLETRLMIVMRQLHLSIKLQTIHLRQAGKG
jgi:hypothetical protein